MVSSGERSFCISAGKPSRLAQRESSTSFSPTFSAWIANAFDESREALLNFSVLIPSFWNFEFFLTNLKVGRVSAFTQLYILDGVSFEKTLFFRSVCLFFRAMGNF